MVNMEDLQNTLRTILNDATNEGKSEIQLSAREVHKLAGDYPGPNHRMPTCCDVMVRVMKVEDEIINQPPKGKGANLIINYKLPR